MRARRLLGAAESVTVELAGAGNINWVRRIRVQPGGRSFVVKQARPALERFPEYQVTTERIVFEARYYETVRPLDAACVCPRISFFDESERVLVLEDLGRCESLADRLARGDEAAGAAARLGTFLGAVHGATRHAGLAGRFANDAMRRLHGDHVFALPFRPNGFPLSEALRARAEAVWRDAELVAIADAAYARYLEPTGALVHADVQGSNVLLTPGGARLVDAEIAHVGDPAFDLGVLAAHLLIPAAASGAPARALPALESLWRAYLAAGARGAEPAFESVSRYAGIEMLRRTIGAARVSEAAEDGPALALLDMAVRLMRRAPDAPATLAAR